MMRLLRGSAGEHPKMKQWWIRKPGVWFREVVYVVEPVERAGGAQALVLDHRAGEEAQRAKRGTPAGRPYEEEVGCTCRRERER